jgi:hypothetical protein
MTARERTFAGTVNETISASSSSMNPKRSAARAASVAKPRPQEFGDHAVPQLLRLLDRAGLAPTSIAVHKPSLDDVFLRQTGRSLREEPAA